METVEIKSIYKLLIGARYIGKGCYGRCFLLSSGEVFKWFYSDCINLEHLEYLNYVSNDYYIGPDKVYIMNGKIIGYAMRYIKGKKFNNLKLNTRFNDLNAAFNTLIKPTEEVSLKKYYLQDLHNENMKYNGKLYVFDLDDGKRINSSKEALKHNMREIMLVFLETVFNLDYETDYDFAKLHKLIYATDYHLYPKIINELKRKLIKEENPTIWALRKKRRKLI